MASLISFPLPKPKFSIIRASSSSPTTTTTSTSTSTSQTLDQQFGRKGIKFIESGDIPTVQLTVRNGSSVSLNIANGLITSYKPKVYWRDDGFEEIVHTLPSTGSADSVTGGIGLVLNQVSESSSQPFTLNWAVKDVDADSIDAVQVELACTYGSLDVSYIVSLFPLSMATAVVVKNNGKKAVNLTSAILSHLKFKGRSGCGIVGLRGCSYSAYPPLPSSFGIVSPTEAMKREDPGWFSFGYDESDDKPGSWKVQDDMYTLLNNKLSRVYSVPPTERLKRIYNTPSSKYEVIDQGKELVFRIIRMGYDDIYVSSPGGSFKMYGTDYFICTGPATMVVPAVVNPGEDWRGAQMIEHDNL